MTSGPRPAVRRLGVVTVVVTYLLIVWGGVVRVSGSGLGCGTKDDWPLCHGGVLPPWRQDALIEFTHRWLAATSTALVVAIAVVGVARWRFAVRRGDPGVDLRFRRRSADIAGVVVALFAVQIVLGAITVKFKLPGYVIAVHLANAELLLGALILLVIRAASEGTARAYPSRRSPALTPTAIAAALTYVLVLSGSLVVAGNAGGACAGWPLCGNGIQLAAGEQAAVNIAHRIIAGMVIGVIGYAVMRVRRLHPADVRLRVTAVAVSVLLVAQVIAGAMVVELRLPAAVRGVHLALASALWATTLLLALLVRTRAAADDAGVALETRARAVSGSGVAAS